jgi:hypothetical protein
MRERVGESQRERVRENGTESERERAFSSSFYRIVFDLKEKKILLHYNRRALAISLSLSLSLSLWFLLKTKKLSSN